jgi:hypothetical protein
MHGTHAATSRAEKNSPGFVLLGDVVRLAGTNQKHSSLNKASLLADNIHHFAKEKILLYKNEACYLLGELQHSLLIICLISKHMLRN